MKLVEFAHSVIETEPAEGSSIVHKLGHHIACWETNGQVTINVTTDGPSSQSTNILSLTMQEDGSIQEAHSTTIGPELTVEHDAPIDPENLPAFCEYVLSRCLEFAPALEST